VIFAICRRLLGAIGAAVLLAATLPPAVFATTYGKLIVRNNAMPASALDTQFSHVRPPRSFLLVVTEPSKTELQFKWSVRCASASHRESGHWVKQVRATWIKHPAYCTGSIVGSAASSPVLVRVFTQ
jgi:hypothetical protein